jgi:hypothetical protein
MQSVSAVSQLMQSVSAVSQLMQSVSAVIVHPFTWPTSVTSRAHSKLLAHQFVTSAILVSEVMNSDHLMRFGSKALFDFICCKINSLDKLDSV